MKVHRDTITACARCQIETPKGRPSFIIYDPDKPDRPYCRVHGENFRLTSKDKTIIASKGLSEENNIVNLQMRCLHLQVERQLCK